MSNFYKKELNGDVKEEHEDEEFDELESIDWENEREAEEVLKDEDLEAMVDPKLREPVNLDPQVPLQLDEQPQPELQFQLKEAEEVAEGVVKIEVEIEGEMEAENHEMVQEDYKIQLKEAEEVAEGIVKTKVEKEAKMKMWTDRMTLMIEKKIDWETKRLVVNDRSWEVKKKTSYLERQLRHTLDYTGVRLCHLERASLDQVTTLVQEHDLLADLIARSSDLKSEYRISQGMNWARSFKKQETEIAERLKSMRKEQDERLWDYYMDVESIDKTRIRNDIREIHEVRDRAAIIRVFDSNLTKGIKHYEKQAEVSNNLASKLRYEIADLDTQLGQAQIRVTELQESARIQRESKAEELIGGKKRQREEEEDELEDDEEKPEMKDEIGEEKSFTPVPNVEEVISPRMSSSKGELRQSGSRMSEERQGETVVDRMRRRGPRASAVKEKSTPVTGKRQRWRFDCVEIVYKRSKRAP